MAIDLRTPDGQPLQELPLDLPAGADSAVVEVDLWYRQGDPGGDPLTDLLVVVQTEDPLRVGVGLSRGVPPQDEAWVSARFAGHDNSADPAQAPYVTEWVPLGAYRGLPFPTLHAGCSRRLELRVRAGHDAEDGATWRLLPLVYYGEHSRTLPWSFALDGGVLTGVGDRGRSALVRGGEVTVSDPADADLHVAARQVLVRGELRGEPRTSVTLDLTDGSGGALVAGESYRAVLTQAGAGGVTVTRGDRGLDPATPTPPAGEPILETVQVAYSGTGAPVLEAGDLLGGRLYDHHLVEPGEGLEVLVHPGQVVAGGTWRFWSRLDRLPVAANATSWLWQLPSGLHTLTADALAPSAASELLAEVDTDAADVVSIRDRRRWAGRVRELVLVGAVPGAPGEIARTWVADADLWIDRVQLAASGPGGTTGEAVFDVQVGGATIYPAADLPTPDDQRPRVLFDAAGDSLVHREGIPERCHLRRGDVVSLHLHSAADGVPPWVECRLSCLY
ncbi:MAG: hypothetical protein AAGN66_08610 [Acidobacteriota bacterium]